MSDFGLFEAELDASNAPGRARRTASMQLNAAVGEVRERFGGFLMGASGKDEFEDRWHLSKSDIRATVEQHIFPNTGTMNRVRQALKREFSATIGDDNADDPTKKAKDGDSTRTINDKQYKKVQKGDKSVTDEVESNSGDGSDSQGFGGKKAPPFGKKDSRRRHAGDGDGGETPRVKCPDCGKNMGTRWNAKTPCSDCKANPPSKRGYEPNKTYTGDGYDGNGRTSRRRTAENFSGEQNLQEGREVSDRELIPSEHNDYDTGESVQDDFGMGGDTGADRNARAAARLAMDMYRDWAQGNGMRVASLATLDTYAIAGMNDRDYDHIARKIMAGEDCDCDDEDSDEESSDGPPQDSDSESEDSGSDEDDSDESDDAEDSGDDSGDDGASDEGGNPFGGDDSDADAGSEPADDGGDEGFAGPPQGPQGLDGGDDSDPMAAGGDPAAVGDPAQDDPGMGDMGGDPGMDPGMGGDFPDAAGPGDDFSIPDAPPQLSPEEQGMMPDSDPQGGEPIPPQIIDEILGLPAGTVEQLVMQEMGGGGGDPGGPPPGPPGGPPPEEDPAARMARKLYAEATGKDWYSKAPKGEPAAKPQTNWDSANGGLKGSNPITPKSPGAKTKSFADSIKSGRRRSAAEEGSEPTEDPAAGGQAVAPADPGAGAPPVSPTQPGPDDSALLDQASQAVSQLVDEKTQNYQQVIDPLQQALQAIQFAQQVEQAANPLDVTPPEGTVDVGPGAQQPPADPAAGGAPPAAPAPAGPPQQPTAALQRHAFKIASRHDLSEQGYHMLLAAMSNQHYRHVAEAIAPLRDPQEKMALASSLVDMFKADNVRFNPGAFMASAGIDGGHTASSPRDRAGDSWADGKDRANAKNEDDDTDPDNWEDREARRLGLKRRASEGNCTECGGTGGEHAHYCGKGGDSAYSSHEGSRHPFAEGGRRTAGETLKPATGGNTMDVYEGDNAKPEFTDNNKLTDLPKLKGPKIGSGVVEKYQHYKDRQEKQGLGLGGDEEVDGFFNQGAGKNYKDIARNKVHQMEGITPHKLGFFEPKVAGWKWDGHQNAYVTAERKPFRCTTAGCNNEIDTPSQTMCKCGRLWYTYGIGDSGHLANNTAQLFLAREIPVRQDVIMANRKMAADEGFNESGEGPFQDYAEDVEFFADDELDNAPVPHAPYETDMDTTRSARRRQATDYPDDHHVVTRDGEKFCSACDAMLWDPNVHHCPEKQASRHQGDWTKYTDDDNAGYDEGPSGPPSTSTDGTTRKDWAKVDGKGRFAPSTFAK